MNQPDPPSAVAAKPTKPPRARLSLALRRVVGRLPFRVVIAVPFAILMIVAVGLTGFLAYQNGQRAVTGLSSQLHAAAAARIQEHLDSYLAIPQFINQLNFDAVSLGQLNLSDLGALQRHFLAQIQRFDSVVSLAYADEQREYVGTYRRVLGVELGVAEASAATGYNLQAFDVKPPGARNLLASLPSYDPRRRPWYAAAVRAGRQTWTPIFVWPTGDVGLDAVVPVYAADQSLRGVLDTSLTLNDIGVFLQGLHVDDHGETSILEKSGLLVASSRIKEPYVRTGDQTVQISALRSADPALVAAVQSLMGHFGALANITGPYSFDFDLAGQRQFANITPYHDAYGLDWLIVTVTPESDTLAQIIAGNRHTILLIALSLLTSVALAGLVSIWVTRPILRLNQSAKALFRGNWVQNEVVDRADEVGELSAAFDHMAAQLQSSFDALGASEARYRRLFDDSPVSLWEEDASAPKRYLDDLRASGVADWSAYFDNHPEAVLACAALLKIVDVNRATLEMFQTDDKTLLLSGLTRCFVPASYIAFRDELVALAGGRPAFEAESVRQTFQGAEIYVSVRSTIVPGYEDTWSKMLVSLTDITQRRRSEMALRRSEETFSTSFRSSPVAMTVARLGGDQHLLEANAAFEHLSGYRRSEILGHTSLELGLSADWQARADLIQRLMADGSVRDLEYDFHDKHGHAIACRLSAEIVEIGGEPCVLTVIVDLTEHRLVEAALRESEQRYRTLAASAFEGIAITEQGVLLDVNEQLAQVLGRTRAELIGQPALNFIAPESRDLVAAAIRSGSQEPYEHLVLRPDGSTVSVETRGRPMEISGRQLRVTAIRDITERQQRERELQTIVALSAALRSAGTLAQMLASILDQIHDLLHADAVTVEIVDPVSGDAVIDAANGAWQAMAGRRIPRGAGLNSYILSSGKPYLNNDVTSDPKIVDPALYDGYRAAAGVAMTAQGQVIGFLWLGRRTNISEAEVRLLAAIADIAANAIRRATLFEQTERRARQLAALNDIDTAISSSLDLNLILNIVLGHVTTQLQVHAAVVLIFNAHTQMLEYAAGRGLRGSTLGRLRLRIGESQAGLAALERRLIAVPDVSDVREIFAHPELLAGEDIRAYFAVPLVAKGRVIGVLEIIHRAPLNPDAEWLDFLTALAGQAAIAIENATLFDDLQRSNVKLSLAYEATIEGWSHALDLRDKETEGHTQRVSEMALRLAQAMGIGADELLNIRRGALLHDIGKMGVPDYILLKPGPLTDEEWVILRRHPELAHQLLSPIKFLESALDIPYCHHEKWDGTGYPRGLIGEAIPLSARIFAIVDVWDALRSDRPYRAGWPDPKVRDYIQASSGTQFDPQVVVVFLRLLASHAD